MTPDVFNAVVGKLERMPPMPAVAAKVVALLRNPDVTVKEIVQVIRLDEVLTLKVLKLANSSYYNRAGAKLTSVEDAVVKLGSNAIVNIALAGMCNPYFNAAGEGYDLRRGELWRHSVGSALLSQRLAEKTGFKDKGTLFTACVIHDIGKTLLDAFVSERREEIRRKLAAARMPFTRAEMDVMGTSHAEVGARILEKWGFPQPIADAVRFHHDPEKVPPENRELAYHVYLCDVMCLMMGIGLGLDGLSYEAQAGLFERFHLTEADVQHLFVTLIDELEKATEFLSV